MEKSQSFKLKAPIVVSGLEVTHVVIGRHYREKPASYMTDELVLELVQALMAGISKPTQRAKESNITQLIS